MLDKARRLIKENEGIRYNIYECTAGKKTIGYGHNLEAKGISLATAELMLTEDMIDTISELETLTFWRETPDFAKVVLMDMCFQMGFKGLLGFNNMLHHIKKEEYPQAAHELLDSKYAVQTQNRANRNATILRTGEV